MSKILFQILLIIIVLSGSSELFARTGLPLPRFVSIKQNEVNVRAGPGTRYHIKWVLVRSDMPMEIIAEFEQWRMIRDIQGDEGWVHQSQVSGKRTVTTTGSETSIMRKHSLSDSPPIARLEPGVIAELLSCSKDACRVEIDDYKGWVDRKNLWGVYPDEVIN